MTSDDDTRVEAGVLTISDRWSNLAGHANGGSSPVLALSRTHHSAPIMVIQAFAHSGRGLGELVDGVPQVAAGHAASIAVAIEVPRGAIVDTLLENDIAVAIGGSIYDDRWLWDLLEKAPTPAAPSVRRAV